MAKFSNFIFVVAGLVLMFYIFGLLDKSASVTSAMLGYLTDPQNIKNTNWIGALVVGSLSLLIGILAGAGNYLRITNFRADLVVFAAAVPFLLSFLYDLILIFNVVAGFSQALAVLIFSPLMLAYVFAIIDWWRGTST